MERFYDDRYFPMKLFLMSNMYTENLYREKAMAFFDAVEYHSGQSWLTYKFAMTLPVFVYNLKWNLFACVKHKLGHT